MLAILAAPVSAATIDYLYIEANEGGSSGGHVALQLGDEVYHFQRHDGGVLKLRRDEADAFELRYALLENRPMHVSRIAVSDETATLLRDAFASRLQIEAAQFERLAALRADVALFEHRQRHGDIEVPVRAAGYFARGSPPFEKGGPGGIFSAGSPAREKSPPSPLFQRGENTALAALRTRVLAAYGTDFIDRRRAALRDELAATRLEAVRLGGQPLAVDAYPLFAPTASTRCGELLEGMTALDVLSSAAPLRDEVYRMSADAPPLSDAERRALAGWADRLSRDLVALAGSTRPDWGYPFMLGMARLAVLEASLERGRLVVLDAYPLDAPSEIVPDGAWRAAFFAALTEQTRTAAARQRAELAELPRLAERDYSALETTFNRLIEIEQAAGGAPLRLEGDQPLLPARATAGRAAAAATGESNAAAQLDAARAAEQAYAAQLTKLYGYNLITRNCVSEVFATIAAALSSSGEAGDATAVARAWRERLGGVVRTGASLNFIPFVSAQAVDRNFTTVAHGAVSSYRQRRLATSAAQGWRDWLRESNTLTSTAYRPTSRDSTFLFFTDEAVAPRPLFGVANLLVGVGQSVLGLATWPMDGGRRLVSGLNGALYSLPELLFVNIRKGTTAFLTRDELATIAPH